MKNIVVVGLNPTLQKTLLFENYVEGEINRIDNFRFDASGKGVNVCRVLQQLGSKSILISHSDGNGGLFSTKVKNDGIEIATVQNNSPIRYCYTLLNLKKNTTTEIIESTEPINDVINDKILYLYKNILNNANMIIFSGSCTIGYREDIIPNMIKIAKENGIRTLLDIRTKTLLDSLKYNPDFIKINSDELIETFPDKYIEDNEITKIKKIITELYKKYKTISIITRGSKDIIYYDGNKCNSIKVKKIKVLNSTGCGDTMTASLANSILKGYSLKDSIIKAVDHAALNALSMIPGTIS